MKLVLALLIALPLTTLNATPAAAIGGPSNMVIAMNRVDGNVLVRSNVQVNREPGMVAAPTNFALANSSCTGCSTIAIALQLNFASKDANYIAPQNAAVAVNEGCDGCFTAACAYQAFFTVDDPTQIPPDVLETMRAFDATLRALSIDRTVSISDALVQINTVVHQFGEEANAVDIQQANCGL